MPRTRNQRGEAPVGSSRPVLSISRMVREGRSWSGRERNCAFLNTRSRSPARFATVSAASGLDFPDDGRALAVTDWDHDGDLDLWVSNRNAPRLRFLRNGARAAERSAAGCRFLALKLRGDGAAVNRDAIGARVEVITGERGAPRLLKSLRAGEGFLAQSSKWLHFGLGSAERIERVVVRWPGGPSEEFRSLEPDRFYEIAQGDPRPRAWSRPRAAAAIAPRVLDLPPPSARARIPLATLIALPELDGAAIGAPGVVLPPRSGKHLLVNLWASWCSPCLGELAGWASREKEIRAAGLDIAALAVDGLGDDRSDPALALERLRSMGFPFIRGRATRGLVELLQYLHDGLIPLARPLPVPSSFLIDREGRLAAIYKGPAPVEDLLRDLQHSRGGPGERFRRAAAFPGHTIDHPALERAAVMAETKDRFQYAGSLERAGRPQDAARQYLEAVKLTPDFAAAHFRLGAVEEAAGSLEAARARYEEALKLEPQLSGVRNALGVLSAKRGDRARAQALFEEEVRLHPGFAAAHNHLGLLHLERGENERAAPHLERAVALGPELADARNNLGVLRRRQGRLDEAAAEYREAIRLKPGFAEAHNNLGAVHLNQGKPAEAQVEFERALEADPGFAPARQNLERARAALKTRG